MEWHTQKHVETSPLLQCGRVSRWRPGSGAAGGCAWGGRAREGLHRCGAESREEGEFRQLPCPWPGWLQKANHCLNSMSLYSFYYEQASKCITKYDLIMSAWPLEAIPRQQINDQPLLHARSQTVAYQGQGGGDSPHQVVAVRACLAGTEHSKLQSTLCCHLVLATLNIRDSIRLCLVDVSHHWLIIIWVWTFSHQTY